MNNIIIKGFICFFVIFYFVLTFSPGFCMEDRYQREIPDTVVETFANAREMRKKGEADTAIEKLKAVIKKQPDYYLAHYNLALALARKRKYNEAIKHFEKAIEIKNKKNIKDPGIYNSFGWVLLLKGDYDRAEKYFLLALSREKEFKKKEVKKILNNLGFLYLYKKNLSKAEKFFTRAAKEFGSTLAKNNLNMLKSIKIRQERLRNNWFVIAATFPQSSGMEEAKRLVTKLQKKRFDAYIINTNRYSKLKDGFWAVVTGPYTDIKKAEKENSRLKKFTRAAVVKQGGEITDIKK